MLGSWRGAGSPAGRSRFGLFTISGGHLVMVDNADQYQQAYSDRTPLKRYVEASEVAALAAFLGSDEGGMITGETSVIDGGFLQS